MKIVLDPGHGGKDRSNRGPTGYVEADGVLDIALKTRPLLSGYFDVRLTRETDTTVDLYQRPQMANEWGAHLFISIHTNAGPSTAEGIESYCSLNGEWGDIYHQEAQRVATILQEELVKVTKLKDRGVKTRLVESQGSEIYGKDYYAVIRRAQCPAVILEIGFHTNPKEEALLKTESFRQTIAEAIATGLKKAYPTPFPNSDELKKLREENSRLRTELGAVKNENKELREKLRQIREITNSIESK